MEPDAAAAAPAPVAAAAAPAAAGAAPPVKRRRGRPRKSEVALGGAAAAAKPVDPLKPKKTRKRKGGDAGAAAGNAAMTGVDVSMIGQQVTGVLDGTFDAGYLLTVRVGASDTILRGVVFSPGLSVPISRVNDVAPGVKHVRREERAPPPPPKLPIAAKPPPPPPQQQQQPQALSVAPLAVKLPVRPLATPAAASPIPPPTQAVLENAAALFTHAVTSSSASPSSGLVAALQQLPGGGYTPDASTFSQSTFQSI